LNNAEHFKRQQEIWAQELRRADERADKFKQEADHLVHSKGQLQSELNLLKDQVQARDQEIARLHSTYQGGQTFPQVKQTF